jgi:acetyl-CoA synthetase
LEQQITLDTLINAGLTSADAERWVVDINDELNKYQSTEKAWHSLSRLLISSHCPFAVHHAIFISLFPAWRESPDAAPVWQPEETDINNANITQFMTELGTNTVGDFHLWTRQYYPEFWEKIITKLEISFKTLPSAICDLANGVSAPSWLPNARLNIIDSCFNAPVDAVALIYEDGDNTLQTMTFGELNKLSNQIANSLQSAGFIQGDAIAIAMPMNYSAVAAYLGIIKMGGIVVSIADSFSPQEISVRLTIANAKGIFTQDYSPWANKLIPLYEKIQQANAPLAIVFAHIPEQDINLRAGDMNFAHFLQTNNVFTTVTCDPMDACNILFSSGTTADPKAIPWNHTTPIKAASDAFFHQNIQPGDVMTWPTNLGWMMGPWLIFAAFINKASIALFSGAPKGREFGEFVAKAKITMLGVVPTLVAGWRQTGCMEGLDWQRIKNFSSTGECSNPEDMFYLMWLANYKPVIEYCGGTEIGGAYVSTTMVESNYASLFTTPAMGSDFTILDEAGHSADIGEVAMIPPSLGLSVKLLNADHDKVYFTGMPLLNGLQLRRHGDQMCRYPNGTYSILGRVDDTMNLGGIKVSAAEIERAIADLPPIRETAAISIKPADHAPSQLVIYAAVSTPTEKTDMMKIMQKRINLHLNPLFKIFDLVFVDELPKTASNKIMRRELRREYTSKYTVK